MLSLDAIFGNADDIPLGVFTHNGTLAPSGSYTNNPTITLPDGITGDYYLFVFTDNANAVNEFLLEGDNVTATSGTTHVNLAPYPDVQVEDLTVSGPDAGGVYTVSWTTANPGTGAVNRAFKERVSLRNVTTGVNLPETVLDVTDSLGVNGTLNHSVTYTITTAGTYQVVVTTDSLDQIYEFNAGGHASAEQNNSTQTTFDVNVDLRVSDSTVSPATVPIGQNLTLGWTTGNFGIGIAGADWTDRVYLSKDQVLQVGTDVLLLSKSIDTQTPLGPGASYTVSGTGTVPTSLKPGLYYVLFVADATGNQTESDETNNLRVHPQQIEVRAADLQVVGVNLSPASLESGGPATVTWQDKNTGGADTPVGSWTDRITVVNQRTGQTVIDTTVAYSGGALSPDGTADRQFSFNVPKGDAGVGDLLVTITTDSANVVLEANAADDAETNNAASITGTATLTPSADLAASALVVVGSTGLSFAGDLVTITWRVDNVGDATTGDGTPGNTVSDWFDRIVLSSDATFGNADDIFVTDQAHSGALAPNAGYDATWTGRIPAGTSGTYYVLVKTDHGTGQGGGLRERGHRVERGSIGGLA